MKDAFYFSHDSNARNDPKIQALMSKWGYEGYGWWWAVLETLRDQPGYRYPMNKYAYGAFARLFSTTNDNASEFISDCCYEFADGKGGLLTIDEQFLWSEAFSRRMSAVDEKREKARKSIERRWTNNRSGSTEHNANYGEDTNEIRTNNERTTDEIQVKERKGKESKGKSNGVGQASPARPTLEEVITYCRERCNGVNPQKWFDHYSSNGWKVGKNPMKDWRAAVRTWESDERGKASGNVRGNTGGDGRAASEQTAYDPAVWRTPNDPNWKPGDDDGLGDLPF